MDKSLSCGDSVKQPIEEANVVSSGSPVDNPDYELVDPQSYEKEFECPICIGPVCDPIVTACGHYFCRACLVKTNETCPSCREPWNVETLRELDPVKDRANRNIIARVLVKCKRCKAVTTRGLKGEIIAKHIFEDCPLPCTHGCKAILTRATIEKHVFEECPIPCGNGCKEMITRATIAAHELVCPNVNVHCGAADLGCELVTARGHMQEHEKSCTRVHLAPLFREQQRKIMELQTELTLVHNRHEQKTAELISDIKEHILSSVKQLQQQVTVQLKGIDEQGLSRDQLQEQHIKKLETELASINTKMEKKCIQVKRFLSYGHIDLKKLEANKLDNDSLDDKLQLIDIASCCPIKKGEVFYSATISCAVSYRSWNIYSNSSDGANVLTFRNPDNKDRKILDIIGLAKKDRRDRKDKDNREDVNTCQVTFHSKGQEPYIQNAQLDVKTDKSGKFIIEKNDKYGEIKDVSIMLVAYTVLTSVEAAAVEY